MRLRAPVPNDAEAVLAVLVARDMVDQGAPDYTLQDLHDEWRGSDVDLVRDAVVVESDDGAVVGYAIIRSPGTLAAVSPEHEGRGIGSRLLAWAEQRDRERGRDRHRQWIAAGNVRASNLLQGAGYAKARSYWRMSRWLEDLPAGVAAPAGVRLRPVDLSADARALHALDVLSFTGNPDYEPDSFEAFYNEHLRAHDFDAELSCVAEQGEKMVGFLLARRWSAESAGFVDVLGVDPGVRGRGLGTALLLDAFSRFAAAGLREAQLGVASDNPRALRLYERVGMTTRHRADVYERPIAA